MNKLMNGYYNIIVVMITFSESTELNSYKTDLDKEQTKQIFIVSGTT